ARLLPLPLGVLRRGEPFPLDQLLGLALGLADAARQLPLRVAVDLLHAGTPALGDFDGVVGSILRLLCGLDRLLLGLTSALRSVLRALQPELDRVVSERHHVPRGLAEPTTLVSGLRQRALCGR